MVTTNNNLPARTFEKQFAQILATVFNARAAFSGAFAPLQTKDGVAQNEIAFTVKTSATPVVVQDYLTGANDGGFGDGSGSVDRFGPLHEIKYADTDVAYSFTMAINEAIDKWTVNNGLDQAVADRLKLQAEAQVRLMNARNGKFLSDNAGLTKELADYTDANVIALFNDLSKAYLNNEVAVQVKAYVNADLYNALVDLASNTTAKNSSVSIDDNGVVKYKGFLIEETPDKYFVDGEIAYFAPDNVAIPFVGIETTRTVQSEHFDGVKLQAAEKGGAFILDDNKVAVVKVTMAGETEAPSTGE